MEFRYFALLLWSFGLVYLNRFDSTDGAGFTAVTRSPLYVNRTQSATMIWRYVLASNEAMGTLECGTTTSTQPVIAMVKKEGSNAGRLEESNFPAEFRGRVVVYDQNSDFGMTISNVNAQDQKDFRCSFTFSRNNIAQSPVYSDFIRLSVRDPPQFINCLGTGDYTVVENNSMNISCSVYGNPVPTLTCYVLRDDNVRVRTYGNRQANITRNEYTGVQRNIVSVQCIADGVDAGRRILTRKVTVLHVPTKPRNLRLVVASTSAMDVSWEGPEKDGGNLINYEVRHGLSGSTLRSENVSVNSPRIQLQNLEDGKSYFVGVRGRNNIGMGEEVSRTFPFTGRKTAGSSTGSDTTTIAIVVPIVVVVVLIIAVAIGCYFKRKKSEPKNLPVSYVEEAVGYPASGKGLYANVDKSTKKPLHQDDESTSGYPDILHQTKERPVEANMNEVEYTPSAPTLQYTSMKPSNGSVGDYPPEDEEMSPSYENSRKEYV